MRRLLRAQAGIAFLEAALSFVVLLPAVLGAFATVAFMREASQVRHLVERYTRSQTVSLFELSQEADGVSLRLNRSAIEDALREMVAEAGVEMAARAAGANYSGEYYIEGAYGVLDINQESGAPTQLEPLWRFSDPVGSLYVPVDIDQKTDLGAAIEQFSEITLPDGASMYALPSVLFGDPGQQNIYAPQAVILGLRIISSLEGTFPGQLFEQVGGRPFVHHFKVVVLRGELGHEE